MLSSVVIVHPDDALYQYQTVMLLIFFTLIKTWNQLACGELTHNRKLAAHVRINYIQLINKLSNQFYAQKIQWFLSIFFFLVSSFNLHLFHEGYRNELIITGSMVRCVLLFLFSRIFFLPSSVPKSVHLSEQLLKKKTYQRDSHWLGEC